jgi:hypothetical protein
MGGPHVGERQARVVALGVVIADAAQEAAGPEPRLDPEQGPLAEPPMSLHIPEQGQGIIQHKARGELPGRHAPAREHREQERLRPDQVGCDPQQDAAFPGSLEDESQGAVLEVAQPAVDEAGGPAARPGRKVRALDERGPEAAHRRIACDPGAGDTSADHEDIERALDRVGERDGTSDG